MVRTEAAAPRASRRRPVAVLAWLVVLDLVAVVVFAALGRSSHAEGVDPLGVLTTAAPFLVGAAAGGLAARSWRAPLAWRCAALTWLGAVAIGLALRAADTGRLPLSFGLVASLSLAVLILGWRAVARAVIRRRRRRAALRG